MTYASRSDRFLARVDARLDGMRFGSARAKFLANQLDQWEYRYRQFQLGLVAIAADADPADAYDYVETISGLAKRLDEARKG